MGNVDLGLLKEMGFEKAASNIEKALWKKKKLMTAYEHFRVVTQGVINEFNRVLKEKTITQSGTAGLNLFHNYDSLQFYDIKEYKDAPPSGVLESMKKAFELGCFDKFVVAKIDSVKEYKDPLLFGIINDCPDYFFIDQWDDDIKISDLLAEDQG